jgi:predicted DNA-binding transcriptional regulator AlpA
MAIPKWLTRKEVADVIRISVVKLDRMRLEGSAPPEMKIGRAVRFAESDLELWLQQQSAARVKVGVRSSKPIDRRAIRKKSRRRSTGSEVRALSTMRQSTVGKKLKARAIGR